MNFNLLTKEEEEYIKNYNKLEKELDNLVKGYNDIMKKYRKIIKQREKEKRNKIQQERILKETQEREDLEQKEKNIYENNLKNFTENYNLFKIKFNKNFNVLKRKRSEFEDETEIEQQIISDSVSFREHCIHPNEFKSEIEKYKLEEGGGGQGINTIYYTIPICLLCYSTEKNKNNTSNEYFYHITEKIKFTENVLYDENFNELLINKNKINCKKYLNKHKKSSEEGYFTK